MLDKLKKMLYTGPQLAAYLEKKGELYDAYEEYIKLGDFEKAGQLLEEADLWHEAANFYIREKKTDNARKTMEMCFKINEAWESFEPQPGETITIEDWLKENRQTLRFVTNVKFTETLDKKGTPLIILLAGKMSKVKEYKGAATLFKKGFLLVNEGKNINEIKNESWLRQAVENYAHANLFDEAAETMQVLINTEVSLGELLAKDGKNPFKDYTYNLKIAKELGFLPDLVTRIGQTDPFNISYDLLKMSEPELSSVLFFKYYGRALDKPLSRKEMDERNQKIQYCLSQYVIFHSRRKEYKRAGQIALLNSQKEMAADLFQKAKTQETGEKPDNSFSVQSMKTETDASPPVETKDAVVLDTQCPKCGEPVYSDWETCPNCSVGLNIPMCLCGEKLKAHWNRCPSCQREIQPTVPTPEVTEPHDLPADNDTKPFKVMNS